MRNCFTQTERVGQVPLADKITLELKMLSILARRAEHPAPHRDSGAGADAPVGVALHQPAGGHIDQKGRVKLVIRSVQHLVIAVSGLFLLICLAAIAALPRPFRPLEYLVIGTLLTALGFVTVFLWSGMHLLTIRERARRYSARPRKVLEFS
jgi:hypothetical protein